MRFYACKAKNWGNNSFPMGEDGYAVMVIENDSLKNIKWLPEDMFRKVFGSVEKTNLEVEE